MIPCVSFYTPMYEASAQRLAASCDRHGLDLDLHPLSQELPTWEQACNVKPTFILAMLRKYDRPIVWLDADAEVMQPPTLFAELLADGAEFAIRNGTHFMSATILVTPAATSLVEKWCAAAKVSPHTWDQQLLEKEWYGTPQDARPATRWLPRSYCQRKDRPEGAVILQHQASRELRRLPR